MFGFIASREVADIHAPTAALAQLAREHGIPDANLRRVSHSGLRIDFFDTASDLEIYRGDTVLVMTVGHLINRDEIRNRTQCSSENTAKLVLRLFAQGEEALQHLDGHLAALIFDSATGCLTILADRFHRYSIVYTINQAFYVSSHSCLLHTLAEKQYLDMESFSQAIHFRWHTGERKLFKHVHQAMPGSILRIDSLNNIQKKRYFVPTFAREENLDLDYWVNQVDSAIDRCLSQIAKKHKIIGLPLSGGVDSSLLLAKAQEHFDECIAVTARFKNGDNPELDNACRISESAGVRHIIADIDDDYVRETFPTIIRLHESAPRNFSDLALARSLDTLKDHVDAVLYGEAADTYFGLGAVHEIVEADRLTKPFRVLPAPIQKLIAKMLPNQRYRMRRIKTVLAEGIDSLIYGIEKIPYSTPPWQVFPCARDTVHDQALKTHLAHESLPVGDRAAIQLLATGVMNHIENTGRLATYYGIELYVPFVLNDIRSVAERLPFGLQNDNGVYKRVLRELACRYFDREYIYTQKYGFPTPTISWLKGPLKERVERTRTATGFGRDYYSSRALFSMSPDKDYEHFWFAICLDELLEQLKSQAEALRVAA